MKIQCSIQEVQLYREKRVPNKKVGLDMGKTLLDAKVEFDSKEAVHNTKV